MDYRLVNMLDLSGSLMDEAKRRGLTDFEALLMLYANYEEGVFICSKAELADNLSFSESRLDSFLYDMVKLNKISITYAGDGEYKFELLNF